MKKNKIVFSNNDHSNNNIASTTNSNGKFIPNLVVVAGCLWCGLTFYTLHVYFKLVIHNVSRLGRSNI